VLEKELIESLAAALERGRAVSLLCRGAERDGALRPLDRRALPEPSAQSKVALFLGSDESRLGALIDQALARLRIASLVAEPHELYVTVHSDAAGKPRVAFAINPSERDLDARLELGTDSAVDALDGEPIHARQGGLELSVARRSVRMLELVSAARA
jgi:beta-galactosidase